MKSIKDQRKLKIEWGKNWTEDWSDRSTWIFLRLFWIVLRKNTTEVWENEKTQWRMKRSRKQSDRIKKNLEEWMGPRLETNVWFYVQCLYDQVVDEFAWLLS